MFPREHPRALHKFEVLQQLGSGGWGQVYLAKSKGGRLVAIKVLGEAHAGEGEDVDAFAREASLCARLQHPTIVQVRAYLEEPGFAALVFEYVAGVALGRLLRFCASYGVRLPDRPAWHVVERVLTALSYAHSFKDEHQQPTPIVHRDVSPSNVLVDWNGGVKLTDFGIAKMLGVSPATRMGLVKGTLGCMAPEQARGEAVTERADVYAAALLAWRLATGRVPFAKHAKDEFEMLRAMRNPRIKALSVLRPDLPEPVLEAIAAALEPEAERRLISAAELATVVRANIDVARGCVELGELLDRWKGALERTVKRQEGDSSNDRAAHTLRYEEVALAFDEDLVAGDSPTVEAHALPSDAAILATLPVDDGELPEMAAPPIQDAPPPASLSPSSIPPPANPDTAPLAFAPSPEPSRVTGTTSTVPPRAHIEPERPPRLVFLLLAIAATLVAVLLVILWAAQR